MEYLHYFETTSAFTEAYNGGGYKEPWVSYTEEDEKVHYNKTEQEKLLETPLTFEITSDGYINWRKSRSSAKYITIEYSKNGVEWTEITSNTGGTHIDVVSGDTVQFRGNNNTYYLSYNNNSTFSGTTCGFNLCGNIMSLINSTNFSNLTEFPEGTAYNFGNLFISCTGLTDASNLILPATTLAQGCYYSMFQGCTSLVTAPELPATTLADSCYGVMFYGCTSLVTAPELPATTLAPYCYNGMFGSCTGLVTAPELPVTTLLARNCYSTMFQGCTSLVTAPELPATTLANYCYQNMFSGCISLVTAPELPATTLAEGCYLGMFGSCTGLVTAPELPVTTLAQSCYSTMFQGCTGLVTAPELPATTLAEGCYYYMFMGCTSLNYVKCLATDISARICTDYWLQDVSASGTFVKNPNMTGWTTGIHGIPNGWMVQDA